MAKIAITLLLIGLVYHQASASPKITPSSLLTTLKTQGPATLIVSMSQGTTAEALSSIKGKKFSHRNERLNTVYQLLKNQADSAQKDLLSFLQQEKSANTIVHQLWVSNQVILENADFELVEKLLKRSDVKEIAAERIIPLHQPIDVEIVEAAPLEEQWGVADVQASAVWATGNTGQNVVVAHIDTGVRSRHEALSSNHRISYGWFDPPQGTDLPHDAAGHGTHTMGSIVGTTRGIGVAPGAQWISCAGCGSSSCTESSLMRCGQWVTCPTTPQGNNEDCTKAPHLVSNSWGGGQEDSFYGDIILAWRAAGIIPLFSQGNSGPACGTANSPGDNELVIGVGATTQAGGLSSFSSVGPTAVSGRVKPDIAAPGSDITSSSWLGNAIYVKMSGTSMSCPHAAGLVALLLSANPDLEFDDVKLLLQAGAIGVTPTGKNCGGVNDSAYPNNNVGWGRINANNSVAAIPGKMF